MKLNYRYGDWGAQISSLKSDFYQNSETRSDGTKFVIPSMRTVNASVYYNFDIGDNEARIKLAVKNIDDEQLLLLIDSTVSLQMLTKITVKPI